MYDTHKHTHAHTQTHTHTHTHTYTLTYRHSKRQGSLVIPRSRSALGDRSFSVAGPSFWNNLPDFIKTSPSVEQAKSRLETYLFNESYSQ